MQLTSLINDLKRHAAANSNARKIKMTMSWSETVQCFTALEFAHNMQKLLPYNPQFNQLTNSRLVELTYTVDGCQHQLFSESQYAAAASAVSTLENLRRNVAAGVDS